MSNETEIHAMQCRHLRIGWASLLAFVLLGGLLESMHGFKVDLRSTPGQGCSFSFSWPRQLDEVARDIEKVA